MSVITCIVNILSEDAEEVSSKLLMIGTVNLNLRFCNILQGQNIHNFPMWDFFMEILFVIK